MAFHFYRTPHPLLWMFPDLLWRIKTREKIIYLTFDDGPVPGPTEYVLDQLAAAGARATFFCVGANIDRYPVLYRRILAAGHVTGNHTQHHLDAFKCRNEEYLADVQRCRESMEQHGSTPASPYFRPPHGRLRPSLMWALKRNYTVAMWSLLSYDFDRTHNPERSLNTLRRRSRPGELVVFHDNARHQDKMRRMLPGFLAHFADEGYRFSALPVPSSPIQNPHRFGPHAH